MVSPGKQITAMRTETYINERKELFFHVQRTVCFVLKISEVNNNEHIHRAGLQWLEFNIMDEVFRRTLAGSRLFWNWWRNQWAMRDLQYLNSIEKGDTDADKKENYLWSHNPRMLSGGIHPMSIRLQKSYAKMIGYLIEREVAA